MTHEFKEIIIGYQKANEMGVRTVIATVVAIDGSSYRRPGVGMLILENGQMIGAVSGGCVEKEVWRQSASVFSTGKPKMMTYNGRYRLGCEGILYILIEPFAMDAVTIRTLLEALSSRASFEITSYYSKDETHEAVLGSVVSFDEATAFKFSNTFDLVAVKLNNTLLRFAREMHPCFRLIIIGSEHDVVQLSTIASATGWEVVIVTPPKHPKTTLDFPGSDKVLNVAPEDLVLEKVDQQTAIVFMSHNFAKDLLYLQAIKDTQPVYIGLLGPAKRREKLLSAFIEYFPEISDGFLDCVHGPAGLNLGAETPQEIAISIIAEILSIIRHQKPMSLQDKVGGIHEDIQKQMIHSIANKN